MSVNIEVNGNINDILNATASKFTDVANSPEGVKNISEGTAKYLENEPITPESIEGFVDKLINKDSDSFSESLVKDANDVKKFFTQSITEEGNNKWNAVSFSDFLGKEELEGLKKSIQSVRDAIQKIKDIVEAARTAVELIKQLEELLEDLIGTILNKVINILENLLNNIASTGVYFLPMWEPYLKVGSSADLQFSQLDIESAYKKKLIDFINNTSTTVDTENIFGSTFDSVSGTNYEENVVKLKAEFNKWLLNNFPYEATTYDEWIETLASAFVDENDKPSQSSLGVKISDIVNSGIYPAQEILGIQPKDGQSSYKEYQAWKQGVPNKFKPGAPQWGKGSSSVTAVFAINLGNYEQLVQSSLDVAKELINPTMAGADTFGTAASAVGTGVSVASDTAVSAGKAIWEGAKYSATTLYEYYMSFQNFIGRYEMKKDFKDVAYLKIYENKNKKKKNNVSVWDKGIDLTPLFDSFSFNIDIDPLISFFKRGVEYSKNKLKSGFKSLTSIPESIVEGGKSAGSVIGSAGASAWQAIEEGASTIDEKLEELKIAEHNKRYSKITPPSQVPNFKGATIESFAPNFWRKARISLSAFKSLTARSTDGWSDSLEELLDSFESRLNKIKKIVNNIDNLLAALETLQNLSISVLIINSNGGVYDIYDKLKAATGFPGQEENQASVILGFAIAAGSLNPNTLDSSINFGDFMKDLQVTLDSNEDFVYAFDTPRDGGEAMLRKFLSFLKKK